MLVPPDVTEPRVLLLADEELFARGEPLFTGSIACMVMPPGTDAKQGGEPTTSPPYAVDGSSPSEGLKYLQIGIPDS